MFIAGKFDVLERPECSYPLVRAFTDLIRQLERRFQQDDPIKLMQLQPVKEALQEIANTDFLLVDKIPILRQFQCNNYRTNDDTENEEDNDTGLSNLAQSQKKKSYLADGGSGGGPDGQRRVQFAFSRLLQAVCRSTMPIVLFLDDLQWSTPEPLGILTALLTKKDKIENFMLLGACRGNEVPMAHPLSVMLRNLEEEYDETVAIVDIRLSNLGESDVESMVQDSFGQLHRKIVTQISNLVWEQGHGNIFFTVQLIRGLLDNHIAAATMRKARIVEVLDMFRFESSSDLLNHVIRTLPQYVQDTLKIASCFGIEFYPSLLEELTESFVEEALALCQSRELICPAAHEENDTVMRFTHDQILESAYGLIPERQREQTHLDIGRRLLDSLSEEEFRAHGFVVMRQLRLGAGLITDQEERYRMAELLMRAGQQAVKTASFDEAASHFRLGIDLLGHRHWRDEYYLSLELYTSAATVAHCNGDYDHLESLAAIVLANARTIEHKMTVFTLQMEAAFRTAVNRKKVIQIGMDALSQTSYPLPNRVGFTRLILELEATKRMMGRFSNNVIENLPRMEESCQEAKVVTLLITMFPAAVAEDPKLCAIIIMRAIRLVFKHGLCKAAPPVFAAFAFLLSNHFGDFKVGERLAHMSMEILQYLKAYEWLTRVAFTAHCFVFSINKPLREVLDPINHAYLAGLTGRDLTITLIVGGNHAFTALVASVPLRSLIATMDSNLKLMIGRQGGHSVGMSILLVAYQFALNMVHQPKNAVKLTGELIVEEEHLAENEADAAVLAFTQYCKLMLCCYYQDYKYAECLVNQLKEGGGVFPPPVTVSVTLFSGVAYAALSKSRTRERLRHLVQTLRQLKKQIKFSLNRYDGHVYFLQAEIAGIQGRTNEAIEMFQRATDFLSKEGFFNIAGLANERAAALLCDSSRAKESETFFLRATDAYQQWGAWAKVDLLIPQLPEDARWQFEARHNEPPSPRPY